MGSCLQITYIKVDKKHCLYTYNNGNDDTIPVYHLK